MRLLEDRVLLGAGARGELEAARAELLDRVRPARGAGARDEARREDDAMDEHGDEEPLDVLRDDVVAAVEQRPGARGALEREAAADGAADDDGLVLARRAHELDEPALEDVVDVDVLRGRRGARGCRRGDTAGSRASSGCAKRCSSRIFSSSSTPG